MTLQGSQGKLDKEEEMKYRMSQGRPHLFTDMRIVNDEGNEMPHDGKATGELEVRGPHVVKAYFRVRSPIWGAVCLCLHFDKYMCSVHVRTSTTQQVSRHSNTHLLQ